MSCHVMSCMNVVCIHRCVRCPTFTNGAYVSPPPVLISILADISPVTFNGCPDFQPDSCTDDLSLYCRSWITRDHVVGRNAVGQTFHGMYQSAGSRCDVQQGFSLSSERLQCEECGNFVDVFYF